LKGEIEEALKELSFPNCYIYQPSILIGARTESRPMEYLSQRLSPFIDLFLKGPLKDYHSISAKRIAKSIARNLGKEKPGIHIQRYAEIMSGIR
jgi:hypothetical protein